MNKLAIRGGNKAVTLSYKELATRPLCDEKCIDAVVDLMKKGEISESPSVKVFSERFASYVGSDYALCTNNGTAALDSALFAVGVAPGDEVLVPSYTFWATMTPILSEHAVPVFCDVDKETFCMDPVDMEKRITDKTKAIMVVHVWGNPCDMDEIMKVAKRHNLAVIEDCSHAHGSLYHGKKVGIIGDVGCFSFQGTKILPAGEGGILVTNNRTFYERSVALAHYEMLSGLPEDSNYRKFALTGMGHKYRIHPLAAAIANRHLDDLDERNEIRDKNALYLEELVKDLDVFKPQKVYDNAKKQYSYQYWYFDAEKAGVSTYAMLKALKAEGVTCGYCGYGKLHKSSIVEQGGAYKDCVSKHKFAPLPVTEILSTHTFLAAPRFENDVPELVEQYAKAFHKIAANLDEIAKFEKENDFSSELSSFSGRSIAML